MTPPAFLNTATLRTALGSHAERVTLRLFDTIDSTNTEAKRHAAAEPASPSLYLARTQTAGRGRLGRTFHSPADTGLYMTLSLRLTCPLGALSAVTPMAAVALAQTVEAVTGKSPAVKWVNDLYLDGAKVAGILTEAVSLPEATPACTRLLVGMGLNVTTARFPTDLRAPATSLLSVDEAAGVHIPSLLAALAGGAVCRLLSLVENLDAPTPGGQRACAACLADYRRRLLYVGEPVLCTRGGETFTGLVCGVDEDYGLLVDVAGERRVLSSGEISVRRFS